jgi:hypothetical protein
VFSPEISLQRRMLASDWLEFKSHGRTQFFRRIKTGGNTAEMVATVEKDTYNCMMEIIIEHRLHYIIEFVNYGV